MKLLFTKYFLAFLCLTSFNVHAQVNQLWGLASNGGGNTNGVLFSYQVSNNIFADRSDLSTLMGINPFGGLLLYNNKLYGTTKLGGTNSGGVIFQWEPEFNTYTDKVNLLGSSTGSQPTGNMVQYNGKLYGMTTIGGTLYNNGVIFEWDPSTNTYLIKKEFTGASGAVLGKNPYGSLVLNGNKFYGMTNGGGVNSLGVIFSWDPVLNTYTKLYDFVSATGSSPQGSMVVYNNKLYGMTQRGGGGAAPGNGVIFQYDILTNTYTKKIDLSTIGGQSPYGDLSLYNNKMYGVTAAGGTNSLGIIFEWDTTTNICTKKIDMSLTTGAYPNGSLQLFNSKLYGMTNSGGTGSPANGVIFEWDPSTNIYTDKYNFSTTTGANPERGALILVPAPVARGTFTTCENALPITITNTNFNSWVPILDTKGDVVAELNANGNLLGTVNTKFYTQNSHVREDIDHKLYLNRNLNIIPQNLPITNISLRLYIKKYELDSLVLNTNSLGQPSGAGNINQVGVFKNNTNVCQSVGTGTAKPISSTVTPYNVDYYFTVNDSLRGSYYFAANSLLTLLPIKLEYFSGVHEAKDNLLTWKLTCSSKVSVEVERSADGHTFLPVGSFTTNSATCGNESSFTDHNPLPGHNFYRLKITENGSFIKYSEILDLEGDHADLNVSITPSLITGSTANLWITSKKAGMIDLYIIDLQGRMILHEKKNIIAGATDLPIDIRLIKSGVYQVYGDCNGIRSSVHRFVKE